MPHRTSNIVKVIDHLRQSRPDLFTERLIDREHDRDLRDQELRPLDIYAEIPDELREHVNRRLAEMARGQNDRRPSSVSPDRLAWYVSFHHVGYPWGIFYDEKAIFDHVVRLYLEFEDKHRDIVDLFQKVIYAITIHELFHYRVDVFALNLEMATGRQVYLPYMDTVYRPNFATPGCLEEALANASTLVRSLGSVRDVLYAWYKRCSDGYSQFDWYDHPDTFESGLVKLMNQICEGCANPALDHPHWFPELSWDDPYYGSSQVPRYIVDRINLSDIERQAIFAKPYRCAKL